MALRLAHLSDTHLGYEAYPHVTSGRNTRGLDIVRALNAVVKDIVADDPPLVIHSGDVFDRPSPSVAYVLEFQRQLTALASLRHDGSRRQVVVIAGNHDLPRSPLEPCMLEVYRSIPGVTVVTRGYRRIDFGILRDTDRDHQAEGRIPDELTDVVVHALPHDDLKDVDFDLITPLEGKVNILTTHGVATGSDLFVRSLGREYAIPAELLTLPWNYVALGHWHKRGPVSAVGQTAATPGVWYAGSPENVSFRDLRDNGTDRGYLQVHTSIGEAPSVTPVTLPTRSMFRLPLIDATGMTPDEVTQKMIDLLATHPISGAVVGQVIEGITREKFSLVDVAAARAAAASSIHYEVTVRYGRMADADAPDPAGTAARGLGDLDAILTEQAAELFSSPAEQMAALNLARTLLGDAVTAPTAPTEPVPPGTPQDTLTVEKATKEDEAA